MKTTKNDISRPGIVVGEILTRADFCYRLKLERHAWSAMLRRATNAGYEICFKDGRQVFVDTTAWLDFMKETRVKNASSKRSGSRSVRSHRSSGVDAVEGVSVG